jgi:membrane protein DedA with SNARE-associated domain
MLLAVAGVQLGTHWVDIRHALQPFDTLIALAVAGAVVAFVWWRLGMPGRPRRTTP